MSKSDCGKGDGRRPCCTGKEERNLREKFFWGEITETEFNLAMIELEKQGKIFRR